MEKVYYISQGLTLQDHITNISNVLEGGCKMIQLRLKGFNTDDYIQIGKYTKEMCDKFDAKLIINDSIEVAKASNAHGVHLGKSDESIAIARNTLGEKAIIGGTANTLEDCIQLIDQHVDYIGLGPFRFTETKKNLSPTLGTEGYKSIIQQLAQKDSTTPIYAIGGIKMNNLEDLSKSGIYGVAVSGLLSYKKEKETNNLMKEIEKKLH